MAKKNSPEFHLAKWEADGSGSVCPGCQGLGTPSPKKPNFKTKKGQEHLLGVLNEPPYGVMTASGAYGPACSTCNGSGKVYGE